ncbi:hypothetical protein NUH88_05560 [Nisaea acidiphila]|uniref:Serine/threonine protein phosphatase n=1 Tax=Nisaea acidiphila TaxID=1862145 RepID=A0A9J7AY16_9PROT|nr:hypothetical protein [Nisaea acidiphila]UUX51156.1 hypothetical protein NUH88_05560 [Nisaea acidiphila]
MSDAAKIETESARPASGSDARFAVLRKCSRIWAIASIHGSADHLSGLHAALGERYEPGDRFVYLGNYYGHGEKVLETVDELLRFRRLILAQPPYTDLDDIVYLRGRQEEMWRKLLQLHFAGDCEEILDWMLAHGVRPTLHAYGGAEQQARAAIMEGLLAVSRWTGQLRQSIRAHPGHNEFMTGFRRAAYTDDEAILFVSAGLDPARDLSDQEDGFWWNTQGFGQIAEAGYGGFQRVVRGFEPAHEGIVETSSTLSIDGGAGFDGELHAVCLDRQGLIVDRVNA